MANSESGDGVQVQPNYNFRRKSQKISCPEVSSSSECMPAIQVQHNKPLLKMLFNSIHSDIKLIIGPDGPGQVTIPAHKGILAIYSEFFKNMFDHEKKSSSVKFPDAEPISFRLFLMYVYSNDFDDLLKEPDMKKLSVALDVLKLAKVYFVEPLVDLVLGHIDKMKTIENVLSIICAYDYLDLEYEKAEVYAFVRRNFHQVTQSEEWKYLPRKFVRYFMDDPEITVDAANEVEIIKALKSWGEAQCSNMSNSSNQGKTNILELRQVLKGLVELIRYKKMNSKEFATDVVPLKILTVEQENKIYFKLALADPNEKNLSAKKYYKYRFYKGTDADFDKCATQICYPDSMYQELKTIDLRTRAADRRVL